MTHIDPRFSGMLAQLIKDRLVDQSALAQKANISRSYLSEILNGKKMPRLTVAVALDHALEARGALSDLIAYGVSDHDRGELAAVVDNSRMVNEHTVAALQRALDALRALDDAIGSAGVIGPASAQLGTISNLVANVIGPQRRPVLYVAAQYAQFAGWLHLSLGRWDGASVWQGRGLEWAVEHGDPDLTATALSYQGHHAWLMWQDGAAVGKSLAALRDSAVHPTQRGYDCYQASRAYARSGMLRDAERMLDLGNEIAELAQASTADLPPWQYHRALYVWDLERGLTRFELAKRNRSLLPAALKDLRAGLAGAPDSVRGADWMAEYMARTAAALMLAGELDEASDLLEQAARIAEATRSPRVGRLVSQLGRGLGQARPNPATRAA